MQNTLTPALNRVVNQPAIPSLLLKPIASANEIVQAWQDYQELKSKLLSETDYQIAAGKKFIKKSGLRKLATAFGISTDVIKEERKEYKDYFVYEITVKAIAPSNRFATACASCASNERAFAHIENDVRATAQTRASNRAISDLIGGGEVSAEEMNQPRISTEEKAINTNSYLPEEELAEREIPAMTQKQRTLLIKLIEMYFYDEETRNYHYKEIENFNIKEASAKIAGILGPRRGI